jgi:hypothetical protein
MTDQPQVKRLTPQELNILALHLPEMWHYFIDLGYHIEKEVDRYGEHMMLCFHTGRNTRINIRCITQTEHVQPVGYWFEKTW